MKSIAALSAIAIIVSSAQCAVADGVGSNFLMESTAKAAQPPMAKSAKSHITQRENAANTLAVPNPILNTGSNIKSELLSPNAVALATQLKVADDLLFVAGEKPNSADVDERLDYFEKREHVSEVLRGAEMDVNYALAEIYNEEATYGELLGTFNAERDKLIAKTNAISFGANGALWALCEALALPTVTRGAYAIPSGITGVLAGVIPSIASALTLKQVSGKKHTATIAPNMLSPMFGRTASDELEYPPVVSNFLQSCPAENPAKKRKDLLIDRWVMDSNIPCMTDRSCGVQIDSVTGISDKKNTVTLSLLSARVSMLQQLGCEIFKMNRLLDELEMALRGDKHFDTAVASSTRSVQQ